MMLPTFLACHYFRLLLLAYIAWVITAQPSFIQVLYVQIASSPPPVELVEFLKGLMNDSFPFFSDSFESLYLDWGKYEEKVEFSSIFVLRFFLPSVLPEVKTLS